MLSGVYTSVTKLGQLAHFTANVNVFTQQMSGYLERRVYMGTQCVCVCECMCVCVSDVTHVDPHLQHNDVSEVNTNRIVTIPTNATHGSDQNVHH